jgi:hypothetical protein
MSASTNDVAPTALALADEQRTANLLTYLAIVEARGAAEVVMVDRVVRERLGLLTPEEVSR